MNRGVILDTGNCLGWIIVDLHISQISLNLYVYSNENIVAAEKVEKDNSKLHSATAGFENWSGPLTSQSVGNMCVHSLHSDSLT